jgi:hypothetical protein
MKDPRRETPEPSETVETGDASQLLGLVGSLAAMWTKSELLAWLSLWCVVSGGMSMRRSVGEWRNLVSGAAFSVLAIYQTRQ